MGWTKGRPRPRKVSAETESEAVDLAEHAEMIEVPREPNTPPPDWRKGMLLNVRNYGHAYIITLHGEEYRPEHPERTLQFTNPGECQDFVSRWYAPEHHDPRAR